MIPNFLRNSLRSAWSRFYRLWLLTYCLILVACWNKYEINLLKVGVISIAWFLTYWQLRKCGRHPYLRIIIDYGLVVMTLVTSSAPLAYKALLALFPIINQHNHSERSKTFSRSAFFLFLWSACFVYSLYPEIYILPVITYIFFVSLIVLIDLADAHIKRLSEDIEDLIFQVLDVTEKQEGISAVLRKFKVLLTSNTLFSGIKELYLLENTKRGLQIRSSTYFDPRIRFKLPDDNTPSKLTTNQIISLAVENSNPQNPAVIYRAFVFEKEQDCYLFVAAISEANCRFSLTYFLQYFFLYHLVKRSVPSVVRLYRRHRDERIAEKKIREDFVKNSQYISSVRTAAHFIRNNINPFTTVSDMLTSFLKDELSVTKGEFEKINQKLGLTQQRILDYINKILESPKKDIFAEDEAELTGSNIFKFVLATLEENSAFDFSPEFDFESHDLETVKYRIKKINFAVLLENVIKNALKHSSDIPSVRCSLDKNGFKIQVSNKFKPNSLISVQQFVGDLTSSSKAEIIKRKGDGLLLIRNTCDNLGAKLSADIFPLKSELSIGIVFGGYNA